jgi:hypothetical protein
MEITGITVESDAPSHTQGQWGAARVSLMPPRPKAALAGDRIKRRIRPFRTGAQSAADEVGFSLTALAFRTLDVLTRMSRWAKTRRPAFFAV